MIVERQGLSLIDHAAATELDGECWEMRFQSSLIPSVSRPTWGWNHSPCSGIESAHADDAAGNAIVPSEGLLVGESAKVFDNEVVGRRELAEKRVC